MHLWFFAQLEQKIRDVALSSSHFKIELVSRQKVISKGVDETLLSFSSSLSGYYGNTGCEELFMGGIQNQVSRTIFDLTSFCLKL